MSSLIVGSFPQSSSRTMSSTLVLEELTSLMGSNQIFSTALRPQSQGIVERSHLELRKALAIVVEAYVRARAACCNAL